MTPEIHMDPPLKRRRRRGRKLSRPDHVVAELGKVVAGLWEGAEAGEPLDPRRANALVYALSTLAGVIAGAEIEREVAELRSMVEGVRRAA